jgi:DNA polymerase (family 10)
MARTAKARGYAYVAMTDHAHYLREGRFHAQSEEIESLNAQLAPFRILRGIEVSIGLDGSLDMPDDDLAACEWVIGSLHRAFDTSPTERVLAAMEHPHVDCIGHPTARKLGRRPGADLDIDRVVAKGLETGTFLEINSQPDRLDLRDAHARAAAEAGLRVVVSTDAHRIRELANVEFGVAQARRAWLTRDGVLNTRTWKQIQALLGKAEKR